MSEILNRDLAVGEFMKNTQNTIPFAGLRPENVELVVSDLSESISADKVTTSQDSLSSGGQTPLKHKNVTSLLERLRADYDASSEMSKTVYALVDGLQRENQALRREMVGVEDRVEQIKRHLSYRVGSAVVNNSKRIWDFWKIPFCIYKAYRDFYADKKSQNSTKINSSAIYALTEKYNFLSVKSAWKIVDVTSLSGKCISLSFFTPKHDKGVTIEFDCVSEIEEGVILSGAAIGSHVLKKGSAPVAVRITSVMEDVTLSFDNSALTNNVRFRLRRIAGGQVLIKFSGSSSGGIDIVPPHLVPPVKRNYREVERAAILTASQMIAAGEIVNGLQYAKRHAKGSSLYAIDLLHANVSLRDEAQWLTNINKYISRFSNTASIELRKEVGPIFNRIESRPCRILEAGPLVSIIMPAFNASKTIRLSLDSLLNQGWKNIEILVVDDCSSDGTWDVLKEFSKRDSRVKPFRNVKNVGPYVSKNLMLQHARGDYITGHDADDWAHPDRIFNQVEVFLRAQGAVKANIGKMLRMDLSGEIVHFAREGKTADDGALRESSISTMFERDYFRATFGHWDCVRFGADSELIYRASQILGDSFVRVRQLGMICLDAVGSLTNDPVHGVSKVTGISPTRRAYRDAWMMWHKDVDDSSCYLDFPISKRKFEAPMAALVAIDDINENLREHVTP